MTAAPLRVAIVGAGPSGIFTAAALVEQEQVPVEVVLLDRLPTPFGLVRYGVAPDHIVLRDVRKTLESLLAHERVRFIGNVEVGRDIPVDVLRQSSDAVVFAYGAAADRPLGIPGEHLEGSLAANELVSWYCGHPDADRTRVERALGRARAVVVVGVGNVALDVTRVLVKDRSALAATDMPQHVSDALSRTDVRDVHVLGRRGPARASFTSKELREIGQLPGVDVVVDPAELELDDAESAVAAGDKVLVRNLVILREWAQRQPADNPRRVHFHFSTRPIAFTGAEAVDAVLAAQAGPTGTRSLRLDAQLVIRAAGYRSLPLAGLPFDLERGVLPNERGRVLADGEAVAGLYATGWVKRGPSGVIGTNKLDAMETVEVLIQDAPALLALPDRPEHGLAALPLMRRLPTTDLADWHRVDAAEIELGRTRGRVRTTLHTRELLLAAAGREEEAGAGG
jgi:ferredoxin--NADP+ reductase